MEIKRWWSGVPGGSVVKKLPAKAGDRGLIPDRGRPHMLQRNEVLSLNLWACDLEPGRCNYRALTP